MKEVLSKLDAGLVVLSLGLLSSSLGILAGLSFLSQQTSQDLKGVVICLCNSETSSLLLLQGVCL